MATLILLSQHQPGGGRVSLLEEAFTGSMRMGWQAAPIPPISRVIRLWLQRLSSFFPKTGEFGWKPQNLTRQLNKTNDSS